MFHTGECICVEESVEEERECRRGCGGPNQVASRTRLHSFQLDPGLPERYDGTEAQYLAERKGMPEAQVADPTGALAWDLKTRLFAAHFTEGETISDPDRLARLAVAAGLDDAVARAALDSPERDAEVRADITRAGQLGIRGVPFFVLADRYGVSGAQPEEAFA